MSSQTNERARPSEPGRPDAAGQDDVAPLGPALVLGNWASWWAYLAGPLAGSAIAVGFAYVLRGRGGDRSGRAAAQGTLGAGWRPGSVPRARSAPASPAAEPGPRPGS